MWTRALLWKDFQFVSGGFRGLLWKCFLYGILLIGALFSKNHPALDFDIGTLTFWLLIAISLEASAAAVRVFSDEVSERSLALLTLLPGSIPRKCWAKVAGCVLGMVPAALAYALGFILWAFETGAVFEIFPLVGWLTWWLLFLHLTAYFSLFSKWGAIPTAVLAIWFTGIALIFLEHSLGGANGVQYPAAEEILFGTLTAGNLLGMAVLQILIVRRIRTLSAQ